MSLFCYRQCASSTGRQSFLQTGWGNFFVNSQDLLTRGRRGPRTPGVLLSSSSSPSSSSLSSSLMKAATPSLSGLSTKLSDGPLAGPGPPPRAGLANANARPNDGPMPLLHLPLDGQELQKECCYDRKWRLPHVHVPEFLMHGIILLFTWHLEILKAA